VLNNLVCICIFKCLSFVAAGGMPQAPGPMPGYDAPYYGTEYGGDSYNGNQWRENWAPSNIVVPSTGARVSKQI